MRSRFPSEVVISLSSSCPTEIHSFSANCSSSGSENQIGRGGRTSKPTSSHVSRIAVYFSSSSSGSLRPPGNAIWALQRSDALDARLMKSISAVVVGSLTHGCAKKSFSWEGMDGGDGREGVGGGEVNSAA